MINPGGKEGGEGLFLGGIALMIAGLVARALMLNRKAGKESKTTNK